MNKEYTSSSSGCYFCCDFVINKCDARINLILKEKEKSKDKLLSEIRKELESSFKKIRSFRGFRLFVYRFFAKKINDDITISALTNNIYENMCIFDDYGFDLDLKFKAEHAYINQLNIVKSVKRLAEITKENKETDANPPKIWVTAEDLDMISP